MDRHFLKMCRKTFLQSFIAIIVLLALVGRCFATSSQQKEKYITSYEFLQRFVKATGIDTPGRDIWTEAKDKKIIPENLKQKSFITKAQAAYIFGT